MRQRGQIQLEDFLGDDTGAVEGVGEPEVGREGMVGNGGDDAVLERVAGLQTQYAHGFAAHVLIGRCIYNGGIGLIRDGAGKDVGRATARMCDAQEGNFDLLETAVVIECEAAEFAHAKLIVDVRARVNFFARIPIGFETHVRFEQLDLRGGLSGGFLL